MLDVAMCTLTLCQCFLYVHTVYLLRKKWRALWARQPRNRSLGCFLGRLLRRCLRGLGSAARHELAVCNELVAIVGNAGNRGLRRRELFQRPGQHILVAHAFEQQRLGECTNALDRTAAQGFGIDWGLRFLLCDRLGRLLDRGTTSLEGLEAFNGGLAQTGGNVVVML